MGAPKQRWTPVEEAALKAGIQKYGVGKWSTILKDPEFKVDLRSRTNVDLKDKWRNLNVMANGLGSRNRATVVQKSSQLAPKQEEVTAIGGVVVEKAAPKHDEVIAIGGVVVEKASAVLETTPRVPSNETIQDAGSVNLISRLDDLILEAIAKLKEPRGSSRQTIAEYIEDRHPAPPDFDRNLAAALKLLTEKGKLVKVKHQYRIAPRSISFNVGKDPLLLLANGVKKDLAGTERNGIVILTKAQIDAELEKIKSMSAEEAAAAAALAVAQAEAAIAEAEAAAREAEDAEAEAEVAHCFADAAQENLQRL